MPLLLSDGILLRSLSRTSSITGNCSCSDDNDNDDDDDDQDDVDDGDDNSGLDCCLEIQISFL